MQTVLLACLAAALVIVPAVNAQDATEPDCPYGWTAYGWSSCFKIDTNPWRFLFDQMQEECEKSYYYGYTGNIATVNDTSEDAFINQFLLDAGIDQAWIGLQTDAADNDLFWTDGSENLNFISDSSQWLPEEPNDYSDRGSCVAKYNTGDANEPWKLIDRPCRTESVYLPAVCRIETAGCSTRFSPYLSHHAIGGVCYSNITNQDDCFCQCKQDENCWVVDWNRGENPWMDCRCWLHMTRPETTFDNENVDLFWNQPNYDEYWYSQQDDYDYDDYDYDYKNFLK